MNNYNNLLENRHYSILEWYEPYAGCGPEGNDLTSHVTLRATVHDCINMQRLISRNNKQNIIGNDSQLLDKFITDNRAIISQ